ncbi:MAG: glycoside hydrolase family 3 C-terminal domain-containing protein [Phycisphaerales bacterium]
MTSPHRRRVRRGLQGDHPEYLKVAACAKHFAVHSGPEKDRHTFDAVANPKDMAETYLPAFKALVEAGVEAVMGAYNRINGEPACASPTLLKKTLREQWGFKGHIVSDCWAIRDIHENHKLVNSLAEAAALAVKHGCDLNCGCAYAELVNAVEQGLLTEDDIDRSVRRLLETRFKLGMFDPSQRVPFADTPMSVVNCERHRALAREAAAESVVLLKNRHNILPIKSGLDRILVVGPNASSLDVLMGTYHGVSSSMTSIAEGIISRADEGTTVEYRMSCLLDHANVSPVDVTRDQIKGSDLVIAVMGLSPILEGEEGDTIASPTAGDRETLGLPDNQIDFIKRITGLGTPVVLVLTGGSALAIPEVHDLVDAVLMVWYPGEQGGHAVADVLFGDTSPSGRLPITVPKSIDQLPPFNDYAMAGRTYRYMTDEPLYPFGFGLSYTRFEYSDLTIPAGLHKQGRAIPFSVKVQNTDGTESEEVVQIYLKTPEGDAPSPRYSLVGMQRIRLAPGKYTELKLSLDPQAMQTVNADGTSTQRSGTYELWVGSCSPDPRAVELGTAPPMHAKFEVA